MNNNLKDYMKKISYDMRKKILNSDEIDSILERISSFNKEEKEYIVYYLTPFGDDFPPGEYEELKDEYKNNFIHNYSELCCLIDIEKNETS